jgi:hypothetical protein
MAECGINFNRVGHAPAGGAHGGKPEKAGHGEEKPYEVIQ